MIRIILGFSVALIALFCFAVAGLFAGKPAFEACRHYLAGGMVVAGVIGYFAGRMLGKRRRLLPVEPGDEELETFSLRDLRYWGPMLFILGVITVFIWPIGKPVEYKAAAPAPAPKKVVVAAAPVPKPTPAPVLPPAPVKFPDMRMQGVIVREDSAFAIINGRSYSVGDHIGDVVVKWIEKGSVALELNGEVKLLTLN